MKRVGLILLALGFWNVAVQANIVDQESALVHFPRTVAFANTFLTKGDYLIVHDDAMAAAGEACLFVYSAREGKAKELVLLLHCTRFERPQSAGLKVVTRRITGNLYSVREIQFPGSMVGHRLY